MDNSRKGYVADSARAFGERRIGKRESLRRLGVAGVGLSGFAAAMLGQARPLPPISSAQAQTAGGGSAQMAKWLQDVGGKLRGTTIRYASESTPPSTVAKLLAKDEFTAHTGINVEIEIMPLEQVLQKAMADSQGKLGPYDLYYLHQSWTALFSGDTLDPRDYYDRKRDLALPDFDWADFCKPLMQDVSTYKDKLVGIPFDIPILI